MFLIKYSFRRVSDIYRFSGGYRWGRSNWGKDNIRYTPVYLGTNNTGNCASFSYILWNQIMEDNGMSRLFVIGFDVPGFIKFALDGSI